MYIDCLWVSGQFKGKGYSNLLMDACIKDSKQKGKKGLVVLSSDKKMGFLADKKYLEHKGFKISDKTNPYFTLMYLPFDDPNPRPKFKMCTTKIPNGFAIYYTNQCPFTVKYVPLLENVAKQKNVEIHTVHINTLTQAQNAPCPFTTFSVFYNGNFITHEILSENKFEKLIESYV